MKTWLMKPLEKKSGETTIYLLDNNRQTGEMGGIKWTVRSTDISPARPGSDEM